MEQNLDEEMWLSTSVNPTAWLMLVAGDGREHAGNSGYDDDPQSHYSWDSTVQNYAGPAKGHVIALWDTDVLLGASVIEEIEVGSGEKQLYRCPRCGKADIKKRLIKKPAYTCSKCEHLFDKAKVVTREVTTYRTRHGAAWVDLAGRLNSPQLRSLCVMPKSQLSLRRLDYGRFREAVGDKAPAPTQLSPVEAALTRLVGGHRKSFVRVRVGQAKFRNALLDRYGNECAFTGLCPVEVLDAAHLYRYSEIGEHHSDGGLLIRRDIHSLFDLGCIAVEPTTLVVDVKPEIRAFADYKRLHGKQLTVALTDQQKKWIAEHWSTYRP